MCGDENRSGMKIRWANALEGSNPSSRTKQFAGMVELAVTTGLGPVALRGMGVRIPLSVPDNCG